VSLALQRAALSYDKPRAAIRWRLVVLVACLCSGLAFAPTASAARIVRLDRRGHPVVVEDRFLRTSALSPSPNAAVGASQASGGRAAATRTVHSELARLYRAHQIDRSSYTRYNNSLNLALGAIDRLRGTRRLQLAAVLSNLHQIAAAGALTPSRLPVLFLTLDRNRQWWTTGPLLSPAQRVEFAHSDLVWQYYVGQGIELQQLGSFGKAQWFCSAGASYAARCRAMLAELIPLAAQRAGGLTWEYYFNFDGGAPPWTSAMSQGTALQALADASRELKNTAYLELARRALPVFTASPPAGVGVRTGHGTRYLQYSFDPAPSDDVINGFLQSLIGLSDYAQTSGDPVATRLFAAGDAEARTEVLRFDTGAWSLYQPGEEDDLNYHTLVTGFLQQLCATTHANVYCATAARFVRYLKTSAVLRLQTRHIPMARVSSIWFASSKISRVGITITRAQRTLFRTSGTYGYGRHAFVVPPLVRAGAYAVKLDSTDLAGNYSEISGQIQVSR